MKDIFSENAANEAARRALTEWGVTFHIRADDGSLLVRGNIDISNKGLTALPDLSRVTVLGNFNCSHNALTSLEGAPQDVSNAFYCGDNQLTSLKGAPKNAFAFFCEGNLLASLKDGPERIQGTFLCGRNRLTSLKGAPKKVGGDFRCDQNLLTSLEDAPAAVSLTFSCNGNRLRSLEGAPETFAGMSSDFGVFPSWDAVPEELRISPETRAQLQREKEVAFDRAIFEATVLQRPMNAGRPLRLKTGPPSSPLR